MLKAIKTSRLELIPISLQDVTPKYLEWLNDSEVTKYMEIKGKQTKNMLQDFVQNHVDSGTLFWSIRIFATDLHIGNIKIDPVNYGNKTAEYGIMIGDKSSWGNGFAKEATFGVLNFCFKDLGLQEITLGVIKENTAALTLYKKIGFSVYDEKQEIGNYGGQLCSLVRMKISNDK
jgi:ribosomal-protein-alanine N-acetyltransferase